MIKRKIPIFNKKRKVKKWKKKSIMEKSVSMLKERIKIQKGI